MIITVPKFPNYYLPPGLEELISVQEIPAALVKNGMPIENRYGTINVAVIARTATFSGSFFTGSPKTDDHVTTRVRVRVRVRVILYWVTQDGRPCDN